MKLILYFSLSFFIFASGIFAETTSRVSYRCELSSPSGKFFANVSLNPETQWMEVILDEGTRIKGYASSTLDRTTGDTVYLLQGATEPHAQQLLLTIKGQGDGVEFQRSYSGHAFSCK